MFPRRRVPSEPPVRSGGAPDAGPIRIAYLTGRYPAVSHTFVMREIEALRRLGVEVETLSIWSTEPENLLTEADRAEHRRTYAFLPPKLFDWVRAHLRAVAGSASGYLETMRAAFLLSAPTPRARLLSILWFGEAILLWDVCRRRKLEHVHVHLNGTAPSVALLASAFAERVGRRFSWSLTVHGPNEFYEVRAEALPEKVRAADCVICISDFARSQLMGMVNERHWAKMHVVHCGVQPAVFAARSAPADDEVHVLSVGRLVQVKGQGVLLEAVAELRRRGVPVRATFVGDGPKRAELEAIACELEIERHVCFAGAVGQDVIRDYYVAADVFCLSSFAEGVPVVLMEAMAMEIPVVATRIMGVGELIEHDRDGLLVAPGRTDLLADALEMLAGNPAERERLGAAGRQKVIAEFDVDASGQQLHDIFHGILRGELPPVDLPSATQRSPSGV